MRPAVPPPAFGTLVFRAIDDAARSGQFQLLRDEAGGQHCGRWDGRQFVYSRGQRIARAITHYCARQPVERAFSPETTNG